MSKKEKQLSTTPWINEEILAKIDYAPRQTQDPIKGSYFNPEFLPPPNQEKQDRISRS